MEGLFFKLTHYRAVINIKIEDQEFRKLFERINARTQNLTPAMKSVGELVRSSVIRNFEVSGRPEPWTTLKSTGYFH